MTWFTYTLINKALQWCTVTHRTKFHLSLYIQRHERLLISSQSTPQIPLGVLLTFSKPTLIELLAHTINTIKHTLLGLCISCIVTFDGQYLKNSLEWRAFCGTPIVLSHQMLLSQRADCTVNIYRSALEIAELVGSY